MKNLYITIMFVIDLVFFADSAVKDYKFFPNLPSGEYRAYFKAIMPCDTQVLQTQYAVIQQNFYLSKRSKNITEIRGNFTLQKPFDDTYDFNFNMAVKDSIGGWKDNAIFYKAPKACSTLKNFMGPEWIPYIKHNFGFNDTNCPLQRGIYIAKGYDVSKIATNTNWPKTFFYGMYKFRLYLTDKNKNKVSCIIYVMDIKRPWENEHE